MSFYYLWVKVGIIKGFDGHFMDKINCGYGKLTEYDYFWFTQQIRKIANKCCKGRIISVLEGGYEISGRGLSPFAMSAAYHVINAN